MLPLKEISQIQKLKPSLYQLFCYSEHSAANLYLFRKIHKYCLADDGAYLTGIDRKNEPFLMILDPDFESKNHIPSSCIDFFKKEFCFYPLTFNQATSLAKLLPFESTIFFSEDDSDYLYDKTSLQTLHGRHLSAKRNLIHQLLHNHPDCELRPLEDSDKPGIANLLEIWRKDHEKSNDIDSFEEAFENRFILGLEGFVLTASNKIIGVSLGESMKETWLYHFAKTHPDFKGATAFLYQETAKALPSYIKEINMEQDLGMAGLRQAKQSFQPIELRHKWKLALKKT